ncbi:hypothetical protein ABT173_03835 [Streptomyces sp. NPDC001795]|uniref:hypothetical protein n=1 Tax=Streptomyces sp. NPDC001795 TaxID=3154525 RepID=UPI003324AFA5
MQQPGYGHQPPQAGPPGFGPPPPAYAPYPSFPAPALQVPPGPDFLAADRHNSVVVDAAGVSFELLGMTADFPWPVIRSVHYRESPNGRTLLMVGVVHVDGRVYECVVDAKRREGLQEWFGQLAAVLGHYRPMG